MLRRRSGVVIPDFTHDRQVTDARLRVCLTKATPTPTRDILRNNGAGPGVQPEQFTNYRGSTVSTNYNRSIENPKLNPDPASNTEKDPDQWVSGDEPMTGAKASYLKTLSEQADDPDAFDTSLTKAEASKRIDALKARTSRTRK